MNVAYRWDAVVVSRMDVDSVGSHSTVATDRMFIYSGRVCDAVAPGRMYEHRV